MPNGDHLKKVRAGEPARLAASAWNAFIDTRKRVAQMDRVGGAGSAGRSRPRSHRQFDKFKIIATATGAGCYRLNKVNEIAGTVVDSTLSILDMSDYFATDATVDYLGVNIRENGQTDSHDLATNIFVFAEKSGLFDEEDRPVVWIRAIHMGNCVGA